MARFSRARLLALARIEYLPDAWRNRQDVDGLLSLVSTCVISVPLSDRLFGLVPPRV